jgi:predicted nucleic acid-binding Zn ribbon protein
MNLDDLADDADNCWQCGAELPLDCYWGIRKYCSRRCHDKARRHLDAERERQRRLERRQGRRCAICSDPIPTSRDAKAKYCSDLCRDAAQQPAKYVKAKRERRQAKPQRACAACGEPVPLDRRADARYCSERCKWTVTNKRARERKAV